MFRDFRQHIRSRFPFLAEKKLLVAVSGGIDSVVLVHLLHRCGFPVALAHARYGLRGAESDADAAFVKVLADQLEAPFHERRFETERVAREKGISVQMAARELRYQWFGELSEDFGYVYTLTAHQADDNLETFLINLSRGAGLEGLTGILEHNGCVIRPLLPFSRERILQYAKKNNIAWREDSSNSQTKYLRNKIRHLILPELMKIDPAFLGNFQKTIMHLQGSRQLLENHIATYKTALFQKTDAGYALSVFSLRSLTPRQAYLYELFADFGFTDWKGIAQLLEAPSGKQVFSATHRLVKDRELLYLEPLAPREPDAPILIEEGVYELRQPIQLRISAVKRMEKAGANVVYVDKEKLKFPLCLRRWRKGDYFYPFGMEGRKKLSKFFKDEKYSLMDKEKQWLLCSGEAVVWVVGKRADDRYRVDGQTRTILKIELA